MTHFIHNYLKCCNSCWIKIILHFVFFSKLNITSLKSWNTFRNSSALTFSITSAFILNILINIMYKWAIILRLLNVLIFMFLQCSFLISSLNIKQWLNLKSLLNKSMLRSKQKWLRRLYSRFVWWTFFTSETSNILNS